MNEKQASVAARIAELSSLPIAELWPVWDRYFSSRPINPNRAFIESRIAYKMQEEVFGGLAHNTRQRLEAIGAKHSKIKLRARPRDINFAPGTVLLREWGDREHKVAVTADGLFEYEGKGSWYPGVHQAIIDPGLWGRVHEVLARDGHTRSVETKIRSRTDALLRGLACSSDAVLEKVIRHALPSGWSDQRRTLTLLV